MEYLTSLDLKTSALPSWNVTKEQRIASSNLRGREEASPPLGILRNDLGYGKLTEPPGFTIAENTQRIHIPFAMQMLANSFSSD